MPVTEELENPILTRRAESGLRLKALLCRANMLLEKHASVRLA
jgi:hypothetical protein